jgi:hypothetical protein
MSKMFGLERNNHFPNEFLKYHEKVLPKSFPMNGHVGMFRQSKIFWAVLCPALMATEVTISP